MDQIRKIISTLGTPTEVKRLLAYRISCMRRRSIGSQRVARHAPSWPSAPRPPRPLKPYEKTSFREVNWKTALPSASENAIEVVSKMVTFDPTARISVADTLRLK